MPLTQDAVQAVWVPAAGTVRGFLGVQSYKRRVVLIAIQGPAGSTLTIYEGHVPTLQGRRLRVYPATDRTYDSTMGDAPFNIPAGSACCFEWTGGAVALGATGNAAVTSEW